VARRHLGLHDLQAILHFHLNLVSLRVPCYLPVLFPRKVLAARGRQQLRQVQEDQRRHSVPRFHDRQLVPVDQEDLADPGFQKYLRLQTVLYPLDCHGRPPVQSDPETLLSPEDPEDLEGLWSPWDQRHQWFQDRP